MADATKTAAICFVSEEQAQRKKEMNRWDHGVGSSDHFLKFLYYTSFLTPHDPSDLFGDFKKTVYSLHRPQRCLGG